MPITIEHIRVLEGPNIYYPQAGVAASLHVSHDLRDELGRQIKTCAASRWLNHWLPTHAH